MQLQPTYPIEQLGAADGVEVDEVGEVVGEVGEVVGLDEGVEVGVEVGVEMRNTLAALYGRA